MWTAIGVEVKQITDRFEQERSLGSSAQKSSQNKNIVNF
jgi:hypothetical protein